MDSEQEVNAQGAVSTLTKLNEKLKDIDEAAKKLEDALECQVILLIFHHFTYITKDVVDDLEFYIRERGIKENKDVCIVLHSLGGDADAAYHIGIRLQEITKNKKLIIIVPRIAKSAGTLLACSGDIIYATPITELGPVDPQVFLPSTGQWVSAKTIKDSLKQAIEIITEMGIKDQTIIQTILSNIPIAEMGHFKSLLDHVKGLLKDLLTRKMMRQQGTIDDVAEKLVTEYEYHGKVIHVNEAQSIGLTITVLEDEKLNAVYELYKKLKDLFNTVDELIGPLQYVPQLAPSTPQRPYKIQHGLIYLPPLTIT